MAILVCPTCAKRFDSDKSDATPFCCERCRMIDLGRWLGEEYGLPVDPQSEVEETSAAEDNDES